MDFLGMKVALDWFTFIHFQKHLIFSRRTHTVVSSICFKTSAFTDVLWACRLHMSIQPHLFHHFTSSPVTGWGDNQWSKEDKAKQNGIQAELAILVVAHLLCRPVSG